MRRLNSGKLLLKILYLTGVFSFLYLYPGVDELELTNMLFHMLAEHFLFTSSGFIVLSLYEDFMRIPSLRMPELRRVYTSLLLLNRRVNRYGILGFTFSAFIIAFWHVPDILVTGTLDPFLHEVMHLSFAAMGGFVYMSVKQLSRVRLAVLLIAFGKIMLWAGLYLSMVNDYIYKLYPLWQHHLMGAVMLSIVPFMDFGAVAYLLHNLFKQEEHKQKITKPAYPYG